MARKKDLLILALALICVTVCTAGKAADSKYLIVTPQVYRTGSDEVISVTLFNIAKRTVIQTLLKKGSQRIVHKSATFHPEDSGSVKEILIKIPDDAKTGYDWKLTVTGSGGLNFKKTKQISVERKGLEVFIQTDKPVYKAGEKVRFRVVAVTPNLRPAKGKVSDIAVVNPTGSRIVQWKNKELEEGFLSLDLSLSKKPVLGTWKITAKYQGVSKEVNIKVDKYVLPKYEVTIENPNYLQYGKKKFSARVCAKYTYGKKVEGKLNVTFCYKYKRVYRWQTKKHLPCVNLNKKINGCADLDVDFESKSFSVSIWNTVMTVHAAVTELATGTILNGTKNVTLINQEFKMTLAETPDFKPGFPFAGKIFIQTYDGKPALNKKIKFTAISTDSAGKAKTLLDFEKVIENGVVEFDLASGVPSDAKYIDIQAVHQMKGSHYKRWNKKVSVSRRVKSWYSPSKTYMKIEKPVASLSVGSFEVIQVKFNPNMMRDNRIFYKLLCRGNIEDSGSVSDSRFSGKIAKAAISIFVTQKMAPKCRLLAFFVRTDGEFIGDSEEIPIEKKFENEVTVSFSESQMKPGNNVSISLQAAPGSRFALSAVDKSVQLLGATNDIKASRIMNMIERLDVSGRGERASCKGDSYPWPGRWRRSSPMGRWWGGWWRRSDHVDGVKAFNDAGLVYFSNLDINVKPCNKGPRPYYGIGYPENDYALDIPMASRSDSGSAPGPRQKAFYRPVSRPRPRPRPNQKKPVKKAKDVKVVVRSEFPETWIWTEDKIEVTASANQTTQMTQ